MTVPTSSAGVSNAVHFTSAGSSNKSVHSTVSAAQPLPSPPDSPRLGAADNPNDASKVPTEGIELQTLSAPMPSVGLSERSFTDMTGDMNEPGHNTEYDPLLLRTKLVGDEEIELRRRATAKKSRGSAKKVGEFYDSQNEHIKTLLKPLSKHADDARDEEAASRLPVKIAVNVSLAANVCLAVLQLYAAASSLSLSFFATASDSVFDPFANVALYYIHRKATRVDPLKYPSGGSRLENIGNIVYAFVMGSVSLILIVESIRSIASHGGNETNEFHVSATVAVGVAFLTKLCLFLYCFTIRKMSSQVQVLWEDHRNDLLVNGFGIFTNAAGAKVAWWIDPAGAMIISLVLIGSWGYTAFKEFQCLAGQSADPDFLRLVTYKAMTFSDDITAIDSCKAYHSGPDYVVEVDIVMPANTPLWKAHDVSQDLQDQLETLPRVDRAFVHVDHEVSHAPEHRKIR